MLPISKEVLATEIRSLKAIVDKWDEKVTKGIPGVDYPLEGNAPPEERLERWLAELIGEFRLVSGKTENVAQVLSSLLME